MRATDLEGGRNSEASFSTFRGLRGFARICLASGFADRLQAVLETARLDRLAAKISIAWAHGVLEPKFDRIHLQRFG